MISKTFVNFLVTAPRRRLVASAIIYGLSMAVRFTSATGEQVEIPAPSTQRPDTVMSVLTRAGAELPYAEWRTIGVRPIFFRLGWLQRASLPSCSSP